jgi:hypothetical protein
VPKWFAKANAAFEFAKANLEEGKPFFSHICFIFNKGLRSIPWLCFGKTPNIERDRDLFKNWTMEYVILDLKMNPSFYFNKP